jgi:cell division transport system permease protein
MTDASQPAEASQPALASPVERRQRKLAPIVPAHNVAGRALVFVIAIMTFLSCLTLGAVTLVRDIAAEFTGVREARIVDDEATARLLEPWLGTGLDLDELPVPRLIIVTIDEGSPPDFWSMRQLLASEVPSAQLDDHRNWVDRLISMARTTVTLGMAVLALMLSATVLTVVFATRGAMAGNGHIIEVLHFVGAEARFIASEFRRHFLVTGMKGAAAGGLAAIVVFLAFSWWSSRNLATPEADQATALFGNFAIGSQGYAGVGIIVILIAALTAATTHFTVISYLHDIEARPPDG